MSDIFDLLDCCGRPTGAKISRGEAHRIGAWHGAFHCLMIYQRDGAGHVLFQLRARTKRIAGGRFDVTVGGHYESGESADTAGPREIREEIGLDIPFESLVPVGKRVFVYCFDPGIMEYEFQDVFLLPLFSAPDSFILQKTEVEGLLDMDVNEGIELFSGRRGSIQARLMSRPGESKERAVSAAEFVPCLDNYYLKLLLLAQRYLNGARTGLAI